MPELRVSCIVAGIVFSLVSYDDLVQEICYKCLAIGEQVVSNYQVLISNL